MLETNIWDPVVAQWLLNPDKSTSSFQQMLADNGIQQKVCFFKIVFWYSCIHVVKTKLDTFLIYSSCNTCIDIAKKKFILCFNIVTLKC